MKAFYYVTYDKSLAKLVQGVSEDDARQEFLNQFPDLPIIQCTKLVIGGQYHA